MLLGAKMDRAPMFHVKMTAECEKHSAKRSPVLCKQCCLERDRLDLLSAWLVVFYIVIIAVTVIH